MKTLRSTPDPGRILVGVVDDHEAVMLALHSLVDSVAGLRFAGSAPTVDSLLERHPDVQLVVLDLRLPDGSSPTTNVERLNAAGADVLIYTSGEDERLVRAAARTGVLGIVLKSAPLEGLAEALEAAANGEPVMSTDLAAVMDSDPDLPRAALSEQERRVLAIFAKGHKAQVVASQLGIAVSTVNDYVRRIRTKYSLAGRPANSKIELYVRAVEDGILPAPERLRS